MWRFDEEEDNEDKKDEGGGALANKLLKTRTIIVAEGISDKTYRKVATTLSLLEEADPSKPVTVYVNSPGGSADSGFAIYDRLRFSPCPITTVANGMVASSAVLVYLAADDGRHLSMPSSRFLLHQPSTFTRGQASDIDITAKEIVKLRTRYFEIVERHTGKPADEAQADASRDFWMNADEASDYKLVDRIIEKHSDMN